MRNAKITCGEHVNAAVNLIFYGMWSLACSVMSQKGFRQQLVVYRRSMGVSVMLLSFQHYSHNPLSAIKYLCDIISFLALPLLELPSVLYALGSYFGYRKSSRWCFLLLPTLRNLMCYNNALHPNEIRCSFQTDASIHINLYMSNG